MTGCGKGLIGRRRGSLPFALVAVTILLTVTAYGAVEQSVSDAEDRNEGIAVEAEAVEDAVRGIRGFVNRGAGEILYGISTDGEAGGLEERRADFDEDMSSWMGYMFPAEDSGVRVTVDDWHIEMGTRDLVAGKSIMSGDGYMPVYLTADGTVTATFETDTGKTQRTLTVSSDGSCALPLSLDRGSMFHNATEGGGSLLSQMVYYELTSLAAFRAANGYGLELYGNTGTKSIISEKDAEDAYRYALRACESLFFRDTGTGELITGDTDIATDFVSGGSGSIRINLNAVYAQALAAEVDDIVGKWFDFFMGNKVLEICDYVDDKLKNAWDSFTSFITGRNRFSAEPYIKEIVGDAYLDVPDKISVTIPSLPGTGAPDLTFDLALPEHDLMGSDAVSQFKHHYRDDSNAVREWLYGVVNAALAEMADDRGFGTVEAEDTGDGFGDILGRGIRALLDDKDSEFMKRLSDTVSWHKYPDQLYAAVYDAVCSAKNEIYDTDRWKFAVNSGGEVYDRVYALYSQYVEEDEARAYAHEMKNRFLDTGANAGAYQAYVDSVDRLMERMQALNSVESKGSSIIEKGCIGIIKGGMLELNHGFMDAYNEVGRLTRDYQETVLASAVTDLDFPDSHGFRIAHGSGKEMLRVTASASPKVTVGNPRDWDGTHQTGILTGEDPSYSAEIPVTIRDELEFTVRGSGPLSEALGIDDSVARDTSVVDIGISVPVNTAWALAGVDYHSDTDVLDYAWKYVVKEFLGNLDGLKELMSAAGEIGNGLDGRLSSLAMYATDAVRELYGKIMAAVDGFQDTLEKGLNNCLWRLTEDVRERIEVLVGIDKDNQTVGFRYLGFEVRFTTDVSSYAKNTVHLLRVDLSGDLGGCLVTAYAESLYHKSTGKGEVNGGFSLDHGDWRLDADIDPDMGSGHLFTMSGDIKGVHVDLAAPELEEYHEYEFRLSNVTVIKDMLSNIPSPIPGTKVALDAGLDVKYRAPFVRGVLINEAESNPEGDDADFEWAEVINLTDGRVDLGGWKLANARGGEYPLDGIELAPGGRCVAHFGGNFLNNREECLTLYDAEGAARDTTGTFTDRENDGNTRQRGMDGSTEWAMLPGTEGEKNTGGLIGEDGLITGAVFDIVSKAWHRAIGEMKEVDTLDGMADLFGRILRYSLDDGIDRLSSCLVEASVFAEGNVEDLLGATGEGVRVQVRADDRMAGDALRYVVGRAESVLLGIADPYGIDLGEAACDDIFLDVRVSAKVELPDYLKPDSFLDIFRLKDVWNPLNVRDLNDFREKRTTIGFDVGCNVSGLGAVLGKDLGTWRVETGVVMRGVPGEMIPDRLEADEDYDHDVWLLRASFSPAEG